MICVSFLLPPEAAYTHCSQTQTQTQTHSESFKLITTDSIANHQQKKHKIIHTKANT